MNKIIGIIHLVIICFLGSWPQSSFGQDALKVELLPKALRGSGLPALVVHAQEKLLNVKLELRRSTDGKRFKESAGPIFAGRSHKFELPMKRGKATYSGQLSVEVGNGQSGSMPLEFEVALVEPLAITISSSDVDLKQKQLELTADRDVARVQVSVMSDTGTPMGTVEHNFSDGSYAAGQKVPVPWKQGKGRVMRINVKAWDTDNFYGEIELFPWKLSIPHEEIHFVTGSAEIPSKEEHKLFSSLKEISDAIAKYGSLAKLKLFIAGHTDSVGDSISNRSLSQRRARSIGQWFRKKGIKISIMAAGLGEDDLLVETPDNTDEIRNRRAEYVVSVDSPPLVGGVRWQKL